MESSVSTCWTAQCRSTSNDIPSTIVTRLDPTACRQMPLLKQAACGNAAAGKSCCITCRASTLAIFTRRTLSSIPFPEITLVTCNGLPNDDALRVEDLQKGIMMLETMYCVCMERAISQFMMNLFLQQLQARTLSASRVWDCAVRHCIRFLKMRSAMRSWNTRCCWDMICG